MPVIYEYIKTQESISTTYEIKKTWVEGNFKNVKDVVDHNAKSRQVSRFITVLP